MDQQKGSSHAESKPHLTQECGIVHGQPATTNMAFGGDDWKTLYITTRSHLLAVNVNIAGIPVPVGPRKK